MGISFGGKLNKLALKVNGKGGMDAFKLVSTRIIWVTSSGGIADYQLVESYSFCAVLLSPVLDGFDQLIKLYCTVLAVN